MSLTKHYVEFDSPGSFFPESTSFEVSAWDVDEALTHLPKAYGKPFAFQFYTRTREDDAMDAETTNRSKRYYLGGKVYKLHELPQDDDHSILRSNIEGFKSDAIKCSTGNWQPFREGDVLLEVPA